MNTSGPSVHSLSTWTPWHTYTRAYTYIYIYTYLHIYIYTHTNTYVCMRVRGLGKAASCLDELYSVKMIFKIQLRKIAIQHRAFTFFWVTFLRGTFVYQTSCYHPDNHGFTRHGGRNLDFLHECIPLPQRGLKLLFQEMLGSVLWVSVSSEP